MPLLEHQQLGNPLLWVVVGAAALSCFFSLTGYSLRLFRRLEMEDAFAGAEGKKALEVFHNNLAALRLTASFGRTLVNLVLVVSLVYLLGAQEGGWVGPVEAVLIALAIIAVIGVGIPHAWAVHAGEKVLRVTLRPLLVIRWILAPVVAVLQAFDMPIRRLSGAAERPEASEEAAKEEILQVAAEGQAEGAVDQQEVEMIASVMEFGDTCAGEIMTPRTDIVALPVHTSWAEAAAKIVQGGHSRLPIYEGDLDNIIGVLVAKDLLSHLPEGRDVDLRKIMRKPFFVPQTKRLDDLLREFKAGKVHLAVVLDEYGGTAGLVTIEDLLEEIVGDISDEYDRATPALMKRLDERAAEVDGRLRIDDLNRALRLDIPEDADYDTIAGFVFSELGYIPTAGEKLTSHGAAFTVLAADARKITKIRVEMLQRTPE